jgi:hypothetical protein
VQYQTTIQNQHRENQQPTAASWRGAHRPPYLFLAMVIHAVTKVVGIGKIKLFRNFIFQKSIVNFTGYQNRCQLFFSDFDMSKKSKITESALVSLFRWV